MNESVLVTTYDVVLKGPIGKAFSLWYRFWNRLTDKMFSVLLSGAFAQFGKSSVLQRPIRLSGESRIHIGDGVFIGANSWLQTLFDEENLSTAIYIGSGTSMAGSCVISAIRCVVIEDEVLLARNVYIADHSHRYTNIDLPILSQSLDKIAPVVVRRGAWIGQNVVVCPGVTIGRGAVIGANSVVKSDIPDWCVAAGAPARVIREFGSMPS